MQTSCAYSTFSHNNAVARYMVRECLPGNALDNAGFSSLHIAARLGKIDLVDDCLELGANANYKSKPAYGRRAPYHEILMTKEPTVSFQARKEILRLLLQKKPKMDYLKEQECYPRALIDNSSLFTPAERAELLTIYNQYEKSVISESKGKASRKLVINPMPVSAEAQTLEMLKKHSMV